MSEKNQDSRTSSDIASDNQDQLERIKSEVGKKYDHSKITINRVPDESIQKLKSLAFEKFAGDYGLTLAYLLEIHELKENFDDKVSVTNQKVLELQNEVMQLREQLTPENNEKGEESKVDTIG